MPLKKRGSPNLVLMKIRDLREALDVLNLIRVNTENEKLMMDKAYRHNSLRDM